MNIDIHWAKLSSRRAVVTLTSLLQRICHMGKPAHKRELRAWENEGGRLAPPARATNNEVTTGSA